MEAMQLAPKDFPPRGRASVDIRCAVSRRSPPEAGSRRGAVCLLVGGDHARRTTPRGIASPLGKDWIGLVPTRGVGKARHASLLKRKHSIQEGSHASVPAGYLHF